MLAASASVLLPKWRAAAATIEAMPSKPLRPTQGAVRCLGYGPTRREPLGGFGRSKRDPDYTTETSLNNTVEMIRASPESYPVVHHSIRRAALRRC